jgi:cell pole-organizing protein PopZ
MEDILASIRRILSEDEPQPATASPPAEPQPAEDSDVLVLDASMEVADELPPADPPHADPPPADPPPADPAAPPPDPFDEALVQYVPPPAPPADPPASFAPEPAPMRLSDPMDTELMAPETAEFTTSAVSSLIRTIASERSTRVYSGGPTIEDLVREEIRPVLKLWLDTHLPDLVERLVRAEIERVVRRAVP